MLANNPVTVLGQNSTTNDQYIQQKTETQQTMYMQSHLNDLKSNDAPRVGQPQLTYSQPTGIYGPTRIMVNTTLEQEKLELERERQLQSQQQQRIQHLQQQYQQLLQQYHAQQWISQTSPGLSHYNVPFQIRHLVQTVRQPTQLHGTPSSASQHMAEQTIHPQSQTQSMQIIRHQTPPLQGQPVQYIQQSAMSQYSQPSGNQLISTSQTSVTQSITNQLVPNQSNSDEPQQTQSSRALTQNIETKV